MLELCGIEKSYGKKMVLNGLSLKVEDGESVLLVGPNGCGKTTLLKIIVGLTTSYTGEMKGAGNIRISSIIETPQLFDGWTGFENLYYFLGKKADDEIVDMLTRMKIIGDCDRKVKKYSLGMKQKLLLALALGREADLYILDEPFNSLDSETCEALMSVICEKKSKGKSVITASHIAADPRRYDRTFRLEDGVLARFDETCSVSEYRFEFFSSYDRDEVFKALEDVGVCSYGDKFIVVRAQRDAVPGLIKSLSVYEIVSVTETLREEGGLRC